MNTNRMPHFNYQLENPQFGYIGCVYMDGKIIHKIDNIADFYLEFGYTEKMMEAGVLPEEYIWMTYQ